MRAIASLLVVDDAHRHRLPPRALRSPHFHSPIWKFARSGTLRVNTHARDRLYFHHGLLILLLFALAARSVSWGGNRNAYPLPEERGTAGIVAALERLPVYVRVLHVTAHPDDESSGMLTWLARRAHSRTALFSLTRGDGGQNVLGDEKY